MTPGISTRRSEERVQATRPVNLDHGTGITRDISASGVFFETNMDCATGSEIGFSIEIDGPAGRKMMLKCQGLIVRVERRDGKIGVAARILASRLVAAN